MNAEAIRLIGETIKAPSILEVDIFTPLEFSLFTVAVLFTIFYPIILVTFMKRGKKADKEDITRYRVIGTSVTIIVLIIFAIPTYNLAQETKEADFQNLIEEWKEEHVKPYISTLPTERKTLTNLNSISIEVEGEEDEEPSYSISQGYLEEGELKTETLAITTLVETTEPKPYIEYVTLEEDLGNGYTEGKYNVTLHLPKGYTLNTIQN